ncbi:efflux RND transporter periplasmic adaptor subunit [Microvirga sp. W0021]|uniref:Efflux RND transporter periplasmic adaptor subunit n=1 Tax=Hohaiivirga grylli TaxID=3133970 RepID=A0ABV0BKF6_9HYPH
MPGFSVRQIALSGAFLAMTLPAYAQMGGPSGPPPVGVITIESKPVVDRTEVSGRVQSTDRVALVARVTAYLEKQLFEDGADVKKGDLLYRLERGPFEADVAAKKAIVAQQEAQGELSNLTLARATQLLAKDAGSQSTADNARAAQKSAVAQIESAKAQLKNSQISLDYTEIRSPIDGRIGRSSVTEGNVVGPTSGTLATVVSQDPMYVVFPMSVRALEELRDKNADKGGLDAVKVNLRLPNGKIYSQTGKIDFVDTTVAQGTDTITLRAVIANPKLPEGVGSKSLGRELINDEFVTVIVEAASSQKLPSVPRAAIMSDQQGDFVYVVNKENVAEIRRVKRGVSTPVIASIVEGLNDGDQVILEGTQNPAFRVGIPVKPVPATSQALGEGK